MFCLEAVRNQLARHTGQVPRLAAALVVHELQERKLRLGERWHPSTANLGNLIRSLSGSEPYLVNSDWQIDLQLRGGHGQPFIWWVAEPPS